MNILDPVFAALTVGPPQQFENLSVFPLIGTPVGQPAYDTLEAALGRSTLRITETTDAGTVREIRVRNDADRPVLIIDGEELVGAKQNRTVNITILVPAHTDLFVPVTCVEAGRWQMRSAQFASAQRTHFAEGRAAKSRQVTESLLASGIPTADQSQVWSAIAAKAERLQARSSTDAMAQIFESHAAGVDAYVEGIAAVEGQRGAVFVIEGVAIGLDLFDSQAILQSMLPKLVRGYAIDAIDRRISRGSGPRGNSNAAGGRESTGSAAGEFVTSIRNAEMKQVASVGAGQSWRLTSPGLSGGALIVDSRVVHASVFRSEASRISARTGR